MKRDKTRTPARGGESEQLASLRRQQERHERLAREHAARANRLWLRRVLLELSQERQKDEAAVKKKGKTGTKKKAGPGRRRCANEACAGSHPAARPRR